MTAVRLGVACVLVCVAFASTAVAQTPPTGVDAEAEDHLDAEARALFEAGRHAFTDGRFADALGYFERAHTLSGRPQLLYNIGACADRLRRDADALRAFEGYLAAVPNAANRNEVQARVVVLREAVDRAQAATPTPPTDPANTAAPTPTDAARTAEPVVGTAQPDPLRPTDAPRSTEVYEQWWFWTLIGAAVAGGVIAAVLVAQPQTEAPFQPNTGVIVMSLEGP